VRRQYNQEVVGGQLSLFGVSALSSLQRFDAAGWAVGLYKSIPFNPRQSAFDFSMPNFTLEGAKLCSCG